MDQRRRESEGKAKIEGYMSVSDEEAHHRSRGDWGQSQFQLGGDDESTHQIPFNGLLFSTFYHFSYTADLPTSTTPT